MKTNVHDLGLITIKEAWESVQKVIPEKIECTVAARVFLADNQTSFHTNEFYDPEDGESYNPETLNHLERGHVYVLTCTRAGTLDIYTPYRYFSKEEWSLMTKVLGSQGRLSFLSVDGGVNKLAVYPFQIKNFYRIPIRYVGAFVTECIERGYAIINSLVKEDDLVRHHKVYSDTRDKYARSVGALNSSGKDMDELVRLYSECLTAYEEHYAATSRFIRAIDLTALQEDAPLRARYHQMYVDLHAMLSSLSANRPDMSEMLNRLRATCSEYLLPGNTANSALENSIKRYISEIFPVLGSPWLKELEKDYILLLTSEGTEVRFSSVDGLLLNEGQDPDEGNQDENDHPQNAPLGDDSLADL